MPIIAKMQLGKKGLTDNFLETLKAHFQKNKNIKISVLKSCCRNKQELKKIAEELLNKLGKNYTARAIGYTINLKKWRSEKR